MSRVQSHHVDAPAMIPDDYLWCRDAGHAFRPLNVVINRRAREIRRELRCHKCRTLKVQLMDLEGFVIRSHYMYPEQQDCGAEPYLLCGLGRLSANDKAAIRVASSIAVAEGGDL